VRCARFDMFIEPVNTFRTGATAPPSHRPPGPRAVFGDKASIRDSPTSASKTSTGKRSGKRGNNCAFRKDSVDYRIHIVNTRIIERRSCTSHKLSASEGDGPKCSQHRQHSPAMASPDQWLRWEQTQRADSRRHPVRARLRTAGLGPELGASRILPLQLCERKLTGWRAIPSAAGQACAFVSAASSGIAEHKTTRIIEKRQFSASNPRSLGLVLARPVAEFRTAAFGDRAHR
jgi:hypothetical protein